MNSEPVVVGVSNGVSLTDAGIHVLADGAGDLGGRSLGLIRNELGPSAVQSSSLRCSRRNFSSWAARSSAWARVASMRRSYSRSSIST